MKKSKLSRKIDHVVKELNAGSNADITASLTGGTGTYFSFPGIKLPQPSSHLPSE